MKSAYTDVPIIEQLDKIHDEFTKLEFNLSSVSTAIQQPSLSINKEWELTFSKAPGKDIAEIFEAFKTTHLLYVGIKWAGDGESAVLVFVE